MSFDLDSRLAEATIPLGDLILSRVLVMNDARFPWLLLVPRRPAVSELIDLPLGERAILMEEIASVSTALKEVMQPQKLNVGALGNQVAQLHVHVIARFEHDSTWPDAVWGHGERVPYASEALGAFAARITERLTFI